MAWVRARAWKCWVDEEDFIAGRRGVGWGGEGGVWWKNSSPLPENPSPGLPCSRDIRVLSFDTSQWHRERRMDKEHLGAYCCDSSYHLSPGTPEQTSLAVLMQEKQPQSFHKPQEILCACQLMQYLPASWTLAGCLRSVLCCCLSHKLARICRLMVNIVLVARCSRKGENSREKSQGFSLIT